MRVEVVVEVRVRASLYIDELDEESNLSQVQELAQNQTKEAVQKAIDSQKYGTGIKLQMLGEPSSKSLTVEL